MPPPSAVAQTTLESASPSLCDCANPTPSSPFFPRFISAQSNFATVRSQWQNPNDVLSLLMIIGGDIVQRAIAQLSGHSSFLVPTAFSFGWVGYSMNAVLLAIGEGRLMPRADCDSIFINARNGYAKANQSWILSRIVRDHRSTTPDKGLTLTFFRTCKVENHNMPGVPHLDWLYWSGVVVMAIQLGIAVIPGAVNGDWNILVVTAAGTLLALFGGALPQWKNEKWACRRHKAGDRPEVICLTRGNGCKDVIVIVNEGEGKLRLEDLANLRDARSHYTIIFTSILAILSFVLLLTVAGLQNNAWYLLAVGSLGMVQNYAAAGVSRKPSAFGIHLEDETIVWAEKVFDALVMAEAKEPGVGIHLLPIFFPGGLKEKEQKWLRERRESYAEEDRRKNETKKISANTADTLSSNTFHRRPADKP